MTFTKVGKPHTEGKEQRFAALCAAMEWQRVPENGPGLMLGAMAAMAITSVVRHYGLVGVTHLAVSHDLAPYGLYGIRCADREYFVVDQGDSCVVAGYTELEKQGGNRCHCVMRLLVPSVPVIGAAGSAGSSPACWLLVIQT